MILHPRMRATRTGGDIGADIMVLTRNHSAKAREKAFDLIGGNPSVNYTRRYDLSSASCNETAERPSECGSIGNDRAAISYDTLCDLDAALVRAYRRTYAFGPCVGVTR